MTQRRASPPARTKAKAVKMWAIDTRRSGLALDDNLRPRLEWDEVRAREFIGFRGKAGKWEAIRVRIVPIAGSRR